MKMQVWARTSKQVAFSLMALALSYSSAWAEIYKCRQGDRVVYQERPCPAGSLALTPPEVLPPPSAFETEAARLRARDDRASVETLYKEEEKREAEATRLAELARVEARKLAAECAKLQDRIHEVQERKKPSQAMKERLYKDQHRYRQECSGF